ncbi:MAG TPA: GNAT family N-acetyltransferase [Vicinamibacteria bacterium]|nr:GNAT family N-acetyltransferase [Vicinamibacteria bacterium]
MRTRPLAEIGARELRPLLDEESEHWAQELLWDYSDVSQAVASGLDRRALNGVVLQDGLRSVAYCYYMLDAGRAIVGSLFAAAGYRGQGMEESLLESVLVDAQAHPGNDRVECQTLFSTASEADFRFARAGFMSRVRHYLVRPLDLAISVPGHRWTLRPLRREDLASAAHVIHASHRGSLDAALNLTYATPGYCRGFVETLVLRAGCGRFDPDASFIAEGPGGPVGVILSSHLSRANGHVCQVSVAPEAQGHRLGEVLMASALAAFRREGLATASLSVTFENRRAYSLYLRLGFRLRKEFAAHAWVRPPARIELPA